MAKYISIQKNMKKYGGKKGKRKSHICCAKCWRNSTANTILHKNSHTKGTEVILLNIHLLYLLAHCANTSEAKTFLNSQM